MPHARHRMTLAALLLPSLAGPANAAPASDWQEVLAQCPNAVKITAEMKAYFASLNSRASQLSGVPRLRVVCDGLKAMEHGYQNLYGAVRACQGQHALGLEPIAKAVSDLRVSTGMKRSQTCD